MKVLGIIAEYNPFHNGHLYHLEKSREVTGADFVVAVMSGNFVQRGEAAVSDKWERARVAVECGIDLVLELPFAYACNNAEYFARGAVDILDGLGCVTDIAFGSEAGDIERLSAMASFFAAESEEFKSALRSYLAIGLSYPAARARAFSDSCGEEEAEAPALPNDILATEYLRELYILDSKIEPHAILRKGEDYGSTNIESPLASAAAIRKLLEDEGDISTLRECMPDFSRESLLEEIPLYKKRQQRLYELITARILTADEAELGQIFSAAEGLENRMKQAVRGAKDLEELAAAIKSRRYTRTRINRLLIHALMGFDRDSAEYIFGENLLYGRVLGFGEGGAELLRYIRKNGTAKIPIVTNMNKLLRENNYVYELLKFDIRAADVYNLISGAELYGASDFVRKPYKKQE